MEYLPVNVFVKSNFTAHGFSQFYCTDKMNCSVYERFVSFKVNNGRLYLTLGTPRIEFHTFDGNGWYLELKDINSEYDLFNYKVQFDIGEMDYIFCQYLKDLNTKISNEFFPWEM